MKWANECLPYNTKKINQIVCKTRLYRLYIASLWRNELGVGLLACYEVWLCGRSWVRASTGAIVRSVLRPTRKLVRSSLPKCPSIPNSEIRSPRGEV